MDINHLMSIVSEETREKIRRLIATDLSKTVSSLGYTMTKKDDVGRQDKTSLNSTKSRRPNIASFFPLELVGHKFDNFDELAQMCHTIPASQLKEMLYMPKDIMEAKLVTEKHLDPIEEVINLDDNDDNDCIEA